MTWLLLFALTALAVVLPMLPAIAEWHRPSDVVPLYIDTQDGLDPTFLARSFVARLAAVVAVGQTQLGRSLIAQAPVRATWPLDAGERLSAVSRRVWHTAGDAELPSGVSFLAEVAAQGALRTAVGGVYHALWGGRYLQLAPRSSVLRWAHGTKVDVGTGCALAGRVSADDSITVRGDTSFTLLHAPTVRFLPAQSQATASQATAVAPSVILLGLPTAVVWDATAGRGTCDDSLDVGAHHAWRGDLVCRADLSLGAGCNARGSLKSHGDITVAAGGLIAGSVVAEGSIALGAGCAVHGSVISETAIMLGAGCVIGAPGHPATVAAPNIMVAPGVVVYGTLWAGTSGHTQAGAVAQAMADPDAGTLQHVLEREAAT